MFRPNVPLNMKSYRVPLFVVALLGGLALALTLLPRSLNAAGFGGPSRIRSFDGGNGWLNSPGLSPKDLRGKIVLVDFWEYTCINCLKTLPYLRNWYAKYHRYGFEIIGVHTPEFKFSGEAKNVAAAVKRLGVTWPVVLDSNAVIWDRYSNHYWPRDFLVDEQGRVVFDHVGEGDYPDTEHRIQDALRHIHPDVKWPPVMGYLKEDSYAKPGAVCYPHTAETYVGSWRGDGAVGNREGYRERQVVTYADAGAHDDGRVYLRGPWYNANEAVVHARTDRSASDYIDVPYHSIQVVAVLKPEAGDAVTVFVDQDGEPVAREDAGKDLRYNAAGHSYLTVDAPREYDIVMNRHFGHHDLRLRPVQYGLGVYTFDYESCEVGADK